MRDMRKTTSYWIVGLLTYLGCVSAGFAQQSLEPDRTLLPDVINSLPGIQPKSAASVSIESLPEATQRALIIEKIRTGADRDAIRILEVSESAVRILEEARKLCVS